MYLYLYRYLYLYLHLYRYLHVYLYLYLLLCCTQVGANMQARVMDLKEMIIATEKNRYTLELHQDLKKMVPTAAQILRGLEQLILVPPHEDKKEMAAMAVAQKSTLFYNKFKELQAWYVKFSEEPAAKKQKTSNE